jgi:basic amino acid/polyamine antiporter, APA family
MKKQQNHTPELKRELGLFSTTVVVIANMIGTGIFTTTGFIVTEVSNPWSVQLCWLAGGIFALCGALCYGELGGRFPRAGGEYIYLREAFGPCLGFLSGWISLIVGFSAPIAAASMAFATYLLSSAVPLCGWSPMETPLIPALTACGVIVCLTLLHYHSLRIGSRVQNGLTLLKVGIILSLILAAGFTGKGDLTHFSAGVHHSPLLNGNWAVSLIFVSFAYSGWNAAAYLGGEIHDPKRNLPRALVSGTLIVTLLYLALNAVFLYALSPAQMAGHADVGALAAEALFTPAAGHWMGIAIAVGLLSALSAMILTGPRVYYAMARDRVFFPVFGRLSPSHRSPAASIFLQAAIAIAMVLSTTFDTLLIYIGFTLALSTLLTVVGLIVLRLRRPLPEGSYRTPGYPFIPMIFILGNAWIIFFAVKSRPVTALFGLGTIVLGLVVYSAFRWQANRVLRCTEIPPRGLALYREPSSESLGEKR